MKGIDYIMTSRRNFYWDIRGIVNSTIEDLTEFDKQEKAIQDKIKSNRYTAKAVQSELQPELATIRRNRETRREDGVAAVRARASEYIAELRKADQLNPDNLTDDIKLLQSGVALSADDLATLFDRNAGNSTMQKLITDFAKQHGRDIQRYYRPTNADLIASVNTVPEVIKTVLKWHNNPSAYEKLIGEGSQFDQYFSNEQ